MDNRNKILKVSILTVFIISTGCNPIYADGPYHGRIIDAATKQPIEGAAVVAIWRKLSGLLVPHPIESVQDAQETLTDKDGNFTIPGIWTISLNPTAQIDEPRFTIFKPGYQAYLGVLKPLVAVDIPTGLYEKDGKIVVELRRLETREERLQNLGKLFIPTNVPEQKYPNLIRLKNIERLNLDLDRPRGRNRIEKQ
jgi:hypothetical protein